MELLNNILESDYNYELEALSIQKRVINFLNPFQNVNISDNVISTMNY